jgi:hypothetical protein
MTIAEADQSNMRSLTKYAWKVLAPREFVIIVLINAPIAWFVYRHAERVPLVGWLSLLVICGPMSFILPALTTFFGYMNGVLARARGRAGSPWPAGARWRATAWRAGLCTAAVVGSCFIVSCILLDRVLPGVTLVKGLAVIVVALYAGILGFLLHARAVIRAGALHDRQDPLVQNARDQL